MLRLSKLTDYAVVVLAGLERAAGQDRVVAVGHAGLVEGLRGARGGYRLGRPLCEIPLSEVIVAFDGPIALTACVDGAMGGCEAEAMCPVRGRWDPVNRAIRDALAHVTVADLAGANQARRAPALALNA